MKKQKVKKQQEKMVIVEGCPEGTEKPKKKWQKPILEDVSGKIMAQPYIRFT